jgi:N-acetylmuramoyl-L-alanine amidase
MSTRKINRIVIHHSENEDNFAIIKRYHTDPKPKGHGWAHVAYHVVIEADGKTFQGCSEDIIAGGCDKASNASPTSLEVCLCGNLNKHTPSTPAYGALTTLLAQWCKKYLIDPDNIVGHKDVQPNKHNPTRPNTCPGDVMYRNLDHLRSRVKGELSKREVNCGQIHLSIEDAIVHAEKNLGSFRKPADRYTGKLRNNSSLVVGFELSPRKRWRLDYDPDPTKNKWVHVNEENFDAAPGRQKVVHLVETLRSDMQVQAYYRKWTSRY